MLKFLILLIIARAVVLDYVQKLVLEVAKENAKDHALEIVLANVVHLAYQHVHNNVPIIVDKPARVVVVPLVEIVV